MNFERGIEPREAMGIGLKEHAIQLVGLLAQRVELSPCPNNHPNNPEIISAWAGKDGSYMYIIEKGKEYSVTYDLGLLNYGSLSIEDVVEALKKDGLI